MVTWRRQYMTILEILIVIMILALVSGVVGWNIRNAIIDQQFRSDVSQIVDRIRVAQTLMLIHNTDTHVIFKEAENGGGITLSLRTDQPLPKAWRRILLPPPLLLQGIHNVEFRDALDYPTESGEIDLKFLSGGAVMSRGMLRLYSTETPDAGASLQRTICLNGYPHPVESAADENCIFEDDEDFRVRMTQFTREEIDQQLHEVKGGKEADEEE